MPAAGVYLRSMTNYIKNHLEVDARCVQRIELTLRSIKIKI